MEYGLIGEHLPHSFSKEIHEQLADYTYDLHELRPDELDGFMRKKDFKAINVTIPYKRDVIPYLDEISPSAAEIGAVNTIVNRDGKLSGFNTDMLGMEALIRRTDARAARENCRALREWYGVRETGRATDAVCAYIIDKLG